MSSRFRIPAAAATAALFFAVVSSLAIPAEVLAVVTKDLPVWSYVSGSARIIASSEQTGGVNGVVELTEQPGYRTPWHRHDDCEETFYVLEGELTIQIGDTLRRMPAGSYVHIPRGTRHAQGNFSDKPLRLLATFSPGGFEQFFVDRAKLFQADKPGSPTYSQGFVELLAKHGRWIESLEPWKPGE